MAQYRLLHLVVELDRSGEWALDGSRTCAQWVGAALDVEVCTAREWLRIGRALEVLPLIDEAFRSGRLSYSKVRMLTRVATRDNEAELCAMAERTPAGRLPSAIAAWLAGHEEPEDTERRQFAARSLTWRTDVDGMVVGSFRLPPWMAATLIAAITAWIMRWRPSDTSTERDNGASVGASSTHSAVVWPSIPQQRADALLAIIEAGGAKIETKVVIHVRADGCSLDDGTPIAGSVVERIAPQSFIRTLIHDAERRPINASGRHRHPTTRQKRVVHERDRGCVDCGATEFLQQDHDEDFEITHHTLVEELKERCVTCHRARHAAQKRGRS